MFYVFDVRFGLVCIELGGFTLFGLENVRSGNPHVQVKLLFNAGCCQKLPSSVSASFKSVSVSFYFKRMKSSMFI